MKLLSLTTRSAVTLFLLGGGGGAFGGGSTEMNKQSLRRVIISDGNDHRHHRFVTEHHHVADQLQQEFVAARRDGSPVDIIGHSFNEDVVCKLKNNKSVVHLPGNNEDDRNLQTNTCPGFDTSIEVDFDTTGEFVTVITGSTVGQPASLPNLGDCVTDSGAPTKWYKFTMSVGTTFGITTCSDATNFDTTVSLFGHSNDAGCLAVCFGQNDNHGTTLDFCPNSEHSLAILSEASANTYYIAVSGQRSWDQGNFELILFAIPPDDGAGNPAPSPTPRPTNRPTSRPTPRPTPSSSSNTDDNNSNTIPSSTDTSPLEPTPSPTKDSPAATLTNENVQQEGNSGDETNLGLVFGLVAVGLVLILIIVVITWILLRKNKKKKKEDNNKNGVVEGNNVETTAYADHTSNNMPVVVATGMASQNTKLGIALARLEDRNGIYISQISERSIFSGQGLHEGMIVKSINGISVSTVEHAKAILNGYQGMLTIVAEYPQQEQQQIIEADF